MTQRAKPELVRAAAGVILIAAGALLLPACTRTMDPPGGPASATPAAAPAADEPCAEPTTKPGASSGMERFAANSPFSRAYKAPAEGGGKRIWADSWLWEQAPKLDAEKWLTAEPNTAGKFVLIEFWATWCPPCRKSVALLNGLHRRFGWDLVVIGVSDEAEADVRALGEKYGVEIEYFSAIDTQARTKKAMGVWGIPHAIIVEPGGGVVWEGFPLLKDYELTEELVGRMIDIGRRSGSLK